MSIYQRFRVEELGSRLARAGILRIWPQLTSSDPSLDHQPAVSALGRALSDRRHIVLVGPAGSGKTILSLQFATTDQTSTAAYLEAQRWAPAVGESMLTQFLTAAGCDVDSATKAFERGNLVVILDAIDEAPWRARGASIRDAVSQLSEELDGNAGMLITSRVAAYVPPLASANVTATLSGIRSEQIEAFLNLYSSSRRGISELADTLKRLPFSENIKYSPLILRLLAESLEAGDIPENLAKLFEKIADYHINRECAKVGALAKDPQPGTWQHCYADPLKHTLLISGLLFNTHEQRQELSEDEFSSAVLELLGPKTLGAHALVDLSTLMAEHPLVSVAYSPKEGSDYYRIEAGHDWVRTSLLPKFLSDDCLTAQIYALDTFHKTLPPPDDFVSAWSDLGDRIPEILRNLETLTSTPGQHWAVCTWLLVQLFTEHMSADAFPAVFSQAAKLAYRFVPESSDMVRACGLSEILSSQLSIKDRSIILGTPEQRGNLSGVIITGGRITIEKGGPNSVRFVECLFDNVQFDVNGPTRVELLRCYIPELHISLSEEGQLTLKDCIYDEDHVVLPEKASLVDCSSAKIKTKIYLAYVLASVLAKFVHLNASKPEASMRKTNINEENVFTGIVANYPDIARKIVSAMVRGGYLSKKPTGSVIRYDPTGSFNAYEGAKFIMSPHPDGVGLMTKDILSRIS